MEMEAGMTVFNIHYAKIHFSKLLESVLSGEEQRLRKLVSWWLFTKKEA
jgi:hypothetical protein